VDAVFDALCVDPRNLGEPAEVAAVVSALGIAPEAFMALVGAPR
jgi:2-hydroxychromene-2-carboxylate isomerase